MKFIRKNAEPQALADWKGRANADWQPAYGDLQDPEKTAVKRALLAEQGGICCYCERAIGEEDSHIEHVRPQSDPAGDALDYGNMVCSCLRMPPAGNAELFCGHAKGEWFEASFVSPLEAVCERRFKYLETGDMAARDDDDAGARVTIEKLNLNCKYLRRARRKVIALFLDDLTDDELRSFVRAYLFEARFNPFWTTIDFLFGRYVDGK